MKDIFEQCVFSVKYIGAAVLWVIGLNHIRLLMPLCVRKRHVCQCVCVSVCQCDLCGRFLTARVSSNQFRLSSQALKHSLKVGDDIVHMGDVQLHLHGLNFVFKAGDGGELRTRPEENP